MSEDREQIGLPPGSGRKLILGLATFTLVGFSFIGLVIIHFFVDQDPLEILKGHMTFGIQSIVGVVFGLLAAILAHFIISRKWMEEVQAKYAGLIGPLKLGFWEILYISICAGIGEEVLFRGAIQPLLGVIFTAVVFVALHGYLNPKDARISVYGFFMVLVMIAMGVICDQIGIVSSMIAHTVIDIYLLLVLSSGIGKRQPDEDPKVEHTTISEEDEN